MANLFEKAKNTTSTPVKKNDKVEVNVNEKEFYNSLSRLAKINAQMDDLKAEAVILSADVKNRGISEFQKLYEEKNKFPGSFVIKSSMDKAPDASMMFIPVDKYITIDTVRANELKKEYGNKIVSENTVYTMDAELVEKYGDVISDLIEKCKKITPEDKEKLISAKVEYGVAKGTISELHTFAKKMGAVIEDVKPIFQLKNIKVEEK